MKRALLALLAAAACGDDAAPPPAVTVTFSLDGQTCTQFCTSIDDCPLECNGEIGYFLIDGVSGDVIDQHCVPIEGTMEQTLRVMPDLLAAFDAGFSVAAGAQVALELVIYPGRPGCPRPAKIDDEWQGPVTPFYAGRSSVYTIEHGPSEIALPVECVSPEAECVLIERDLTTWVTDLNTLDETVPVALSSIVVSSAILVPTLMPVEYDLVPEFQLELVPPGDFPVYGATKAFSFNSDCYATLVTRIGGGLNASVGSCNGADTGDPTGPVLATSYFIDKPIVDAILRALEMTDLPEEGLVIGRISNGTNPMAGNTVRPVSETTTMIVTYLEKDEETGEFALGPSGSWFVITDMKVGPLAEPCCDRLEIVDENGPTGSTTFNNIGLVRGLIMGIEIF